MEEKGWLIPDSMLPMLKEFRNQVIEECAGFLERNSWFSGGQALRHMDDPAVLPFRAKE